jgi:hypothetical protein
MAEMVAITDYYNDNINSKSKENKTPLAAIETLNTIFKVPWTIIGHF